MQLALVVHWLLVVANVVLSSLCLVTLIMEVLGSSKTPVPTRATWRNIPEEGSLQPRGKLVNGWLILGHVQIEL
jgi:hypothetical protein